MAIIRKIGIVFLIIATIAACKPAKKVQSIQAAISKRDTAQQVIIKESPTVDSAAIVHDIMSKVMRKKIDFTTFNAKVKVDYESATETTPTVTAYISIKKDSAIFIKITYPLAGVIAQVLVNKDSVFLLRKKEVQERAISYLQEVTEIPFDFSTLQDMIVGNPVFISNNITSYKAGDKQLQVFMIGNLFKHLITLDNTDFKVLHSKLDDVDIQRNRTCDITFGSYQNSGSSQFATYRKISVAEKSKLDIYLDFKQFSFNDPLNYRFTIPKNYKRK